MVKSEKSMNFRGFSATLFKIEPKKKTNFSRKTILKSVYPVIKTLD